MIPSFRKALSNHAYVVRSKETAKRNREFCKNKAGTDVIAKCRSPFQAAAITLKYLMDSDPDFRKFLKERVATIKHRGGESYRRIASTTFGQHDEQDGWKFEMTPTYKEVPTEWYLALDVSDEGMTELKIRNNTDTYAIDPADVPTRVLSAFRPVLKILQNRRKVYQFLLNKFGTSYSIETN